MLSSTTTTQDISSIIRKESGDVIWINNAVGVGGGLGGVGEGGGSIGGGE